MATAPTPASAAPVVAGEIILLDPHEIELGERLRPIDMAFAEATGRSMKVDGQIHAIHVCRFPGRDLWHLAGPGGHRLVGARLAGIPIEAREVSPLRDSHRRREAVENAIRRENTPLEKAEAVAELVRLHKLSRGLDPTKDGRAASVATRWQKALKDEAADTNVTLTVVYGWTDEIAAELGVSKSSVERDLFLYRRLSPSATELLRAAKHPILGNASQLRALAKLDEPDQARAVECLIGDATRAPAKSLSEATARMRGANRVPTDRAAKHQAAFVGGFSRMPLSEKKGALHELAPLLPAGFALLDPQRSRSIAGALDEAMKLLVKLCDGEPVEDEEIHEATGLVQQALTDMTAAAAPTEGGKA